MTDDCGVIRKPNIFGIIASAIWGSLIWGLGILVYYKRTLDIDLDGARMDDGTVYLSGIGSHA